MKKILLGLSLGLSPMSLAQNSSRFISGKVADYTLGEMPLTAFIYNTQGTFKVGHGNVAEDGIFWLILDKEVSADALEPLLTDVTCDNLPDISTAAINLEFADGLGYLQQASSIEVLEQGLANVGNAKSGGIMYSPPKYTSKAE